MIGNDNRAARPITRLPHVDAEAGEPLASRLIG